MTLTFAIVGLALSCGALGASTATVILSRRHLQLVDRQRERDFEATVVAELARFARTPSTLDYEIRVTNAGPAVARDVDVSVVEWNDETVFGEKIETVDVAPALLRGEQRTVMVHLPLERARFDDRSRSIELMSDYYDDNGVRNIRLAFVYDGELILTPPQPPYPSQRRLMYPRGS
jgi:hypothetical protein